jgi:hypothetical protein
MTYSRIASACALALVLFAPGFLTVAATQVKPKYGVSVQAITPAALAKARTYMWTEGDHAFNKQAHTLIVAAIDRELAARGLTKVPSGSSHLLVSYDALGRTDVNLKESKGNDYKDVSVGMLVVNLRDAANKQSVFRVRMDTPMERNAATIEAEINTAVAAIFGKYPPAKR